MQHILFLSLLVAFVTGSCIVLLIDIKYKQNKQKIYWRTAYSAGMSIFFYWKTLSHPNLPDHLEVSSFLFFIRFPDVLLIIALGFASSAAFIEWRWKQSQKNNDESKLPVKRNQSSSIRNFEVPPNSQK